MDTEKYYLGRIVDPQSGKTGSEALLYEADDLTTHAVVVGMTGSGKTGLCLDLLEEAALNRLPALMVDPKGDITNAVLHFPELAPADFQPWINADQARREGKSLEEAAAETAALWRDGLATWDIGQERLQALKDRVQFTIYTPGSDAGVPVSILASLQAPDLEWAGNREIIRERITSTVSSLLGLIGLTDIDPVRSREHILLANIFEHAWSQGKDLSLSELIMQTQNPPFDKLGIFEVSTFFPDKDRFELAMLLNNMLAAPTFQSWIEGQPLDVGQLLYAADGRPRHSIFYIAHLNDQERMFFVTLLFTAVESWMRAQSGTTALRALLYFDEIFGYLPPISNPPSKEIMLRMLKQARAFGLGLVLATQNPVDVDYKALSNAGTWFIGRLQTDQDKQRLLDGLTGATGGFDRRAYDELISRIGKRVFLLHSVHEKQPQLMQTRWAMNYLAGPMTRNQIPALNSLAGVGPGAQETLEPAPLAAAPMAAEPAALVGTETRPAVPKGVNAFFLPNNITLSEAARNEGRILPADAARLGVYYRPFWLAQAAIAYQSAKYNLDYEAREAVLAPAAVLRGLIHWDDHQIPAFDPRGLEGEPEPEATYAALEAPLNDARALTSLEGDFIDWLYRNATVEVKANETLGIYAGPDVSEIDFQEQCADEAEDRQEAEVTKAAAEHEKKIDRVEDRLDREERELQEDESEHSRRKQEEAVSHAETLIGLFSRRRRSLSSSMTKRRMTEKAREDVEESVEAIEELKEELDALEEALADVTEEIEARWAQVAKDKTVIQVKPSKKDILVEMAGVAWLPYYRVKVGSEVVELVAHQPGR